MFEMVGHTSTLMFATPTPANTPHLSASASSVSSVCSVSSFSPEHVVVDVAEANHAEQGMPLLALAPSVAKALRGGRLRQQNPTPQTAGLGNAENVGSVLAALKLSPNSSLRDTPYRG